MVEPAQSVAEPKIEMRLARLAQLFNSLDPSPFRERDLDADAEDYIIGSAEEISRRRPLQLLIHLPANELPRGGTHEISEAVHNYFAYREVHQRRRLRRLFHDGQIALATGLMFLLCCTLLREVALSFSHGSVSEVAVEGTLIVGWVAMWRPLEIFLYDWVPIRRRCRILAKLAKMPVIVETW
jgi:hypothetical protein